MHQRVKLTVSMELLSDTIFGSGFCIPGGEDIAVCVDQRGYPYLKGSTFKGLLRESMENWLTWTREKNGTEILEQLMGRSGRSGLAGERRIQLTALTLRGPAISPQDCFSTRMFTQLEGGTVRSGSLRMAACVRRGLAFQGELYCAAGDVELVQNSLAGIKWVGTMRSRGLGSVKVTSHRDAVGAETVPPLKGTHCIRYSLKNVAPVIITDLGRSKDNSYETRGYIPGSAIRGYVMGTLAQREPEWFQAHRIALLSEETRFLDAVPVCGDWTPLPSVKGFYENKEETVFRSIVREGSVEPGLKRAKAGSFCAIEADTLRYWSASTSGTTRILRGKAGEETRPFQTRYLREDQLFSGYILLENDTLAEKIAEVLSGTIWLGADRYEGAGQCKILQRESADRPAWLDTYGYRTQKEIGTTLYLLAISPFTTLNGLGEPEGISERSLAELLGVDRVTISVCSTSMSEYGSFNRMWNSRSKTARMYDPGSLFRLEVDQAPALEKIRAMEWSGLGIRRAEGYGQVLFLRNDIFEGIRKKSTCSDPEQTPASASAEIRRAKYRWIMENDETLQNSKLSASQMGTIQSLCEKAVSQNGDTIELQRFLVKNQRERGARHGERFVATAELVQQVLRTPMQELLRVPCEDRLLDRLRLLIALFDFHRKEKG